MSRISISIARCIMILFIPPNFTSSVEKCNLSTKNDFVAVNRNRLFKISSDNWTQYYMSNKCPYTSGYGKRHDKMIDFSVLQKENHPIVLLSIFVDKPTPFFDEFLKKIENIDYPKNKMFLSITTLIEFHKEQVDKFISRIGDQYNASFVFHKTNKEIINARQCSLSLYICNICDFLFYVESEVHLDNPQTLKILITQNRNIIAPMLSRPFKIWSKFWGSLSKEEFYTYTDIINYNKTGIWNVPYISSCYLMKSKVVKDNNTKPSYNEENLDYDLAFSKSLRKKGVFMYIDNEYNFGHLIDSETFNITQKNPEMYQLFENRYDWEQRYVHQDYKINFDPDKKPIELCPDVFWFPIVSEQFCKELIEIMEHFDRWSDGTIDYERMDVGSDPVPTIDIHLSEVGLHKVWLKFLDQYVSPLQERVFQEYKTNNPLRSFNFVVKYNPTGQALLEPHEDNSAYTTNIALNSHGKDYQGGGCHFWRYKCKVTNTKVGWMIMHPGQQTHSHEGLEVTNGTRYILVSFIDPLK